MKNFIKFTGMLFSIFWVFMIAQTAFAENLKDISPLVGKHVDMKSISDTYKVHNATDGDDVKQITFINTQG